jgi:hypothetical protein
VLNRLKADDVKMPAASTAGKRRHLRRWAISIAIALLLHAVAGVFVLLTWKSPSLNPNGPVIVELPPPPAEPKASPGEAAPVPDKQGTEQQGVGEQTDEANRAPEESSKQTAENADREVAPLDKESTEPTFASQNVPPAAPSENAEGENATEGRTASGRGGPSAASGGQAEGGSIDTRIAPYFGPRAKKPSRTLARKPSPLAHTATTTNAQGHSRRLSAPAGDVINAIGARVPSVAAANALANKAEDSTKNAIGSNVANPAGGVSASAPDLPVINSLGIPMRVHPSIPRPVAGQQGTGAIGFDNRGRPVPAVNGTGMNRVGLGAGGLGGPSRSAANALNGTSFRPQLP